MEFGEHGLSDVVTVALRNVCSSGYGEQMRHKADAVFLDLPSPWEAVPYATDCFKTTGKSIRNVMEKCDFFSSFYSCMLEVLPVLSMYNFRGTFENVNDNGKYIVVSIIAVVIL